MSQTDRILPRYFLSRVRVSVRPRIFLYAKKLQKNSLRPITDRQRHHRQNGATRKAVHTFTPGGATYVTIHTNVTETQWMILLALQNPTLQRKLSALQRSSQARQRMRIIREEAHTLPVPTPPSLGAGLRPSSLDRPGHAGKRQLSEVSPSPPIIPSATMATDAALHSQVICTCISLKFIKITGN